MLSALMNIKGYLVEYILTETEFIVLSTLSFTAIPILKSLQFESSVKGIATLIKANRRRKLLIKL